MVWIGKAASPVSGPSFPIGGGGGGSSQLQLDDADL